MLATGSGESQRVWGKGERWAVPLRDTSGILQKQALAELGGAEVQAGALLILARHRLIPWLLACVLGGVGSPGGGTGAGVPAQAESAPEPSFWECSGLPSPSLLTPTRPLWEVVPAAKQEQCPWLCVPTLLLSGLDLGHTLYLVLMGWHGDWDPVWEVACRVSAPGERGACVTTSWEQEKLLALVPRTQLGVLGREARGPAQHHGPESGSLRTQGSGVWLAWLQAQTFQTAGGAELPCSGSSSDSRIWRSKGTLPASAFHSTCFPGSCLQSRTCSGLAECRAGLATCLRVQCGAWLLWSSTGPGSSTRSSGGPRGTSCPGPPPPQQAIFQDRVSGCTWKH